MHIRLKRDLSIPIGGIGRNDDSLSLDYHYSLGKEMSKTLYIQPDSVVAQELDQDLVLLDMATEVYFSLDSVGRTFWNVALNAETEDHAVDLLLEKYEVDRALIESDFSEFTIKLVEMGLLMKVQQQV
jgi:hypothetical protein